MTNGIVNLQTVRRKRAVMKGYIVMDAEQKGLGVSLNGKTVSLAYISEFLYPEIMSRLEGTNGYKLSLFIKGGGYSAQRQALMTMVCKCISTIEQHTDPQLKKLIEVYKTDVRRVERKKPGLRKARERKAWRKR